MSNHATRYYVTDAIQRLGDAGYDVERLAHCLIVQKPGHARMHRVHIGQVLPGAQPTVSAYAVKRLLNKLYGQLVDTQRIQDIRFLRDLARRLMRIAPRFGTDQGDTDRLNEIASKMEAR